MIFLSQREKHRGKLSQRARRTQRRGIEKTLCVLGDLCEIFVFPDEGIISQRAQGTQRGRRQGQFLAGDAGEAEG